MASPKPNRQLLSPCEDDIIGPVPFCAAAIWGGMTDTSKTDRKPDDEQRPQARRAWHPPQFYCTDVASTYVVSNAGTDGGPMGSFS